MRACQTCLIIPSWLQGCKAISFAAPEVIWPSHVLSKDAGCSANSWGQRVPRFILDQPLACRRHASIVTFIVGIGYCDTTLDIYSPSHLIPREESVSAIASVTSISIDAKSCPNTRRSRVSRQATQLHCYQHEGTYHATAGVAQDSYTIEIDDQPASMTGLATYQPPGQLTWYPNFRFSNDASISVLMTISNLRSGSDYPDIPMAPDFTPDYYLAPSETSHLPPDWNDGDPILFKIWWYSS
jgi:hypothetical protein